MSGTGAGRTDPWQRLQDDLATRHALALRPERRRDHPDHRDLANLPILLRQANAVVDREVRGLLARHEPRLDPTAYDLLRRARERPSYGVDLAAYLRRSPQRISEVVARLEEHGLVESEGTWVDARRRRVLATEAGLELVGAVEQDLDDLAHHLLDGLGIEAQETLVALVAVLAEED